MLWKLADNVKYEDDCEVREGKNAKARLSYPFICLTEFGLLYRRIKHKCEVFCYFNQHALIFKTVKRDVCLERACMSVVELTWSAWNSSARNVIQEIIHCALFNTIYLFEMFCFVLMFFGFNVFFSFSLRFMVSRAKRFRFSLKKNNENSF